MAKTISRGEARPETRALWERLTCVHANEEAWAIIQDAFNHIIVGNRRCAKCGSVPLPPSDPSQPITADSDRAKHEFWCPTCQNLCDLTSDEEVIQCEIYNE